MGDMTTSVLLINRQLVFAVTIKQALEQTGAFTVHPFTAADAALEYLRDHPHDVAVVDFTLPDYSGPQLVRRLRAIQPGIAVIVSPAQPNARALMQELDLQGIVDAPFSARTIIPVIEHAVELIEQPLWARTRSLVDDTSPDSSATDVLVDPERELADLLPPDLSNAPLYTGPLSDAPDETGSGATPLSTRMLDMSLEDDAADFPPAPPVHGAETRILDDMGDDSPLPWEQPAPDKGGRLPFSSLSSILMDEAPSEMFEPAVGDEDTPSVPAVDSDAVRQFLATYHPMDEVDTFGDVLGAIDPAAPAAEGETYTPGSFDDLVNSMRAERQRTPLPDRHQQFIEFILTGGMDTLLTELEKAKTGEFEQVNAEDSEPAPEADSFTVLAAEEPPLPTLEESGTVGDLMIGVSDSSFRNVLALMRGEQVVPSEETDAERFSADFDAFYASPAAETAQAEDYDGSEMARASAGQEMDAFLAELEEAEAPSFVSPAPPRETLSAGIPARLILETAQDESTPADSFSLDTLINDIERQLEQHLPEVKPLPSWGERFKLPRRAAPQPPAAEDVVQEPDFLSEMFGEPEALAEPAAAPALPTWDDAPDEAFETTLASEAQRQLIEAGLEAQETEALFSQAASAVEDAPPAQPEPTWPQGELDMSSMWESFMPAESYQEYMPYADEEAEEALPAFAGEAPFGGDAPAGLTAPAEEYPDFLEGLLPTAPPAAEMPPLAPAEPEPQPAVEIPAAEPEPAVPADAWGLTEAMQGTAEAAPMPVEAPSERYSPLELEPIPALDAARPPEVDDPYIAQLALSLTQVSLELTAEATLLTRDGEIAAVAGTLAPEDIDALRGAVSDAWAAGEDDARIRFLALDGGSREFMVYSRRTVGGFTLSMIFAGTTPLRDIRRQGKRLSEALAAVPETPLPPVSAAPAAVASAPSEPTQAVPLAPYTYMWLLRDPNVTLNQAAAQALAAGLRAQLTELGWQVQALRAQDEYVYVYADVPGEQAAFAVADDLKRRAANILRAQGTASDPRALWADSYLVLTPGRELDADEIAQFIEFERML